MTNKPAKAQLLDLLIEQLKGFEGLNAHRQNLIERVMSMLDLKCAITSIASLQAISEAPEPLRVKDRNS